MTIADFIQEAQHHQAVLHETALAHQLDPEEEAPVCGRADLAQFYLRQRRERPGCMSSNTLNDPMVVVEDSHGSILAFGAPAFWPHGVAAKVRTGELQVVPQTVRKLIDS
eukprot:CAMPEP_0175849878 /NCGR_PEP_ID=MMETSP0107_2-20121207/24773_1 /TAXON_ID=195067 ORGANISM="Goniomonas pacifica, Strain CCMP1869" /NCGR_SAMPLE_ID=MMETSP0107_2 /ASSEMBLY_ACC=CAM_ASM_000203 /LENGTH=109 /DNA_ID=CAMNT_0017165093 /DNA_START=12 /DNA_END=341 /DNA_ORIENTATION=+